MEALYQLESYVKKKNNEKKCKCGCIMKYSMLGFYKCPMCSYKEKDLYGKIKDLLEMNPNLSKIEISLILNISLKNLNQYVKNGYIVNPNS